MKLHEFQAKERFRAYGLPTPRGIVAEDAEAAQAAYTELGGDLAVVKAQIHAGGRGKAGGVKLVRSAKEAQEPRPRPFSASRSSRSRTAPDGTIVRKVLIEEGLPIKPRSTTPPWCSIVSLEVPVLMVVRAGRHGHRRGGREGPPRLILREPIDPVLGLAGLSGAASTCLRA